MVDFTVRHYAKRSTCCRRVSVRPSVFLCVCVCVSVTLRDRMKTTKSRITQIMPHNRPRTLVSILTSASRSPSAIAEPLVYTG